MSEACEGEHVFSEHSQRLDECFAAGRGTDPQCGCSGFTPADREVED